MSAGRVECPRCGQDWLLKVRLLYLGREAIWCPECDALWHTARDVGARTFEDYGTFMNRSGRENPFAPGELETIGFLFHDTEPQ